MIVGESQDGYISLSKDGGDWVMKAHGCHEATPWKKTGDESK